MKVLQSKQIRNSLLVIAVLLFLYRIGNHIIVPGIDESKIVNNESLNMLSLLTGASLGTMSLFALGVSPYITSSIVVELLSNDVIGKLSEWKKEGGVGRIKLNRVIKYLSIILSLLQGYSLAYSFDKNYGIVENGGFLQYLYIAVVLTAGMCILMWIGNHISEKNMGNGISMIILVGILYQLPSMFIRSFSYFTSVLEDGSRLYANGILMFVLYCFLFLFIIFAVIYIESAERRIPIQYSSKLASGSNLTFIPLKLNTSGVLPVIFASAFIQTPLTIIGLVNSKLYQTLSLYLSFTHPLGLIIYALFILFFGFFYTEMQISPKKLADELSKNGGFIPSIRSGKETVKYITNILYETTSVGLFCLLVLAWLPYLLAMILNVPQDIALGGTSAILIVGITLEIVNSLITQVQETKYKQWF